MTRRQSAVPWWAEAGPDRCDFCERAYYVEVGYVCIECDRPICPICVVTVRERRAIFCPECGPAGER